MRRRLRHHPPPLSRLLSVFPPSAGLPGPDPAELPQLGHLVRPEAAAAGGGTGGGPARGPGGMPEGRGAEGGVREPEGGDEAAADQPEGAGQY